MGGEQNVLSIDKYITYPIAKKIAPYLYNLGVKPNHVTIFNILFRIYIFKKMINNDVNNLLSFFIISHFLDCLDGTIARKYNLGTKFGGFLDQLSDKIFWGSTILLTLNKCKNNILRFNQILVSSFLLLLVICLCEFRDKCFLNNSMEMNAIVLIFYYYFNYSKC
jgi:phosphatidylglycerophosphate synthase